MTTQEEINKGMINLLMIATALLKEADKGNNNFILAQNLVKQCFFKYIEVHNCPFREVCNETFAEDYEPEPPYGRDDRD